MKEKIRKFMDDPLTMRRCLKMTAISYGAALAAYVAWYAIDRAKDAWEDRKQIEKIRNEYTKDNLE